MVLFLNDADVAMALGMRDCIRVVEEGFRSLARGEAVMAPRICQGLPGGAGALRVIAAALPKAGWFGLKSLTGIPGRRLPGETHFVVLLFEMSNGGLRAIISANLLTGIRTGAATGVAAKYLAVKDAETVGIFGAGTQANYQVQALCAVRAVTTVKVYAPRPDQARSFAAMIERELNVEAYSVPDPRAVVIGSKLLVMATTAQRPVFSGEWLQAGTHISGVGSNTAGKCELDGISLQRSRIVTDARELAIEDAGDVKAAIKAGRIRKEDVATELGEIVAGLKPGRENESEITLFKSLGLAVQDVVSATYVYERAMQLGLGQFLES